MTSIWDSYRHFNVKVGVSCKSIEEFNLGSKIVYDDKYDGCSGSGTIFAFAQHGYEPTVWITDSATGDAKCVMLGWCRLKTKEDKANESRKQQKK